MGLILPEDRSAAAEKLRSFLMSAKPGVETSLHLRCTKEDGSHFTALCRSRMVENTNYGMLFYIELLDLGALEAVVNHPGC